VTTGDEHDPLKPSTTEELAAREHLAGCDVCQQEFAEVTAARAFVRGLGEVEPPTDYIDRVLTRFHRRQQTRWGLVGLVGVAALWIIVLIIGAGLALPEVSPPVSEFAGQHEVASVDPERLPEIEDVRVIDAEDVSTVATPFVVPDDLATDFERVVVYDKGEGIVQALYRNDDTSVSLFEQEGVLDWESLPPEGLTEIDGQRAWVGTVVGEAGDEHPVVIIAEWPVVYTLVGGDPAHTPSLVRELPDPQEYTLGDRARQSVDNLSRRLGLD
jgi:hypothetical protein